MARSSASSSERPDSAPAAARVYLDYAGFTPVDPRVVAFMRPFLEGGVGNPAALHSHGLEARASLDGARAKVARLVGGTPFGVIFTASATEANNLAIKGVALRARGRHVVTSAVEHISVVNSCRDLEKQGWSVTWLPVDREGFVDLAALETALDDETVLVSVMYANNEVGTIEPIEELVRIVKSRDPRIAVHTDAVQAAGYLDLNVDRLGADLVGMSTAPEAVAARAAGMRCMALSLVTNWAAGIAPGPLDHEEVIEEGRRSAARLEGLLRVIVRELPSG